MKNIVHIPVLKSENRSVNYTNHTAVCTGHTVISTNHTVTLTFLAHKDRLSCRHPQVLAAISLVLSKERSQKHTQQDNKQKACIHTALTLHPLRYFRLAIKQIKCHRRNPYQHKHFTEGIRNEPEIKQSLHRKESSRNTHRFPYVSQIAHESRRRLFLISKRRII